MKLDLYRSITLLRKFMLSKQELLFEASQFRLCKFLCTRSSFSYMFSESLTK